MIFRRALPLGPALRDRLGRPRRVRAIASSPRSRVWRAEFAGTPAVVKQIVGGADAARRFGRELTALRLAGATRPAVVPEVLAADPQRRVLVLEHLTEVPDREPWAIRYATALARLHALSPGDLPADTGPAPRDVRAFLDLAGALGVTVPAGADDELAALLERLRAAGTAALLHGDPCPGNEITTAGGIRFVDLEGAAAGAGITELAYLRIGFPTCWCVRATPEPVLLAAEREYRETWRSVRGGDPPGDLADACLGWVVQGDALVERAERRGPDHFARMLRADWRWGTMTARERLTYRLGVAAAAADGRADLAGTVRLGRAMREALARL
ncbi:phosphotransferase [Actinoplanes sp. NPDC048967]|uniref:phosphotransferase n=1 Tax=Actinoplanes sp. NPDC048967 TaxID=3155269 RepID=UPI0033C115E7